MGRIGGRPVMTLFALIRGGWQGGGEGERGDDRSSQDTDGGSACQCDRAMLTAGIRNGVMGRMVAQAENSTFNTTTHHL